MNWNDLQYFLALVKVGTLSAAAELLGVQHATVARRIENLEKALNIQLFNRMGKRYMLTTEGELLYAQAGEIEKNIHTFTRMAIGQNAMQGTVIVSAPPVLANEFIMPKLSQLQQQYPDVCLSLHGDMHYSNLNQREADIAIRIGRPTEENLVIRRLAEVNYCFYAHSNYRVQETIRLVDFPSNQRLSDWSKQVLRQCKTSVVFSSNDLYAIKNAICQGMGIGVLPCFMVKPTDNLVIIEPVSGLSEHRQTANDKNSKTEELYLVMHNDVRRSIRVRAVADWIVSIVVLIDS